MGGVLVVYGLCPLYIKAMQWINDAYSTAVRRQRSGLRVESREKARKETAKGSSLFSLDFFFLFFCRKKIKLVSPICPSRQPPFCFRPLYLFIYKNVSSCKKFVLPSLIFPFASVCVCACVVDLSSMFIFFMTIYDIAFDQFESFNYYIARCVPLCIYKGMKHAFWSIFTREIDSSSAVPFFTVLTIIAFN